jgi:hypothetical protein
MGTPDPHPHLTLFFGIWAAVGPMVGLWIGHILTTRGERSQWIRDCRKTEFRELISLATKATIEHLAFTASQTTSEAQPMSIWLEAHKAALNAIGDRIYIKDEVDRVNLLDSFLKYSDELRTGIEGGPGRDEFSEAMDKLRAIARSV